MGYELPEKQCSRPLYSFDTGKMFSRHVEGGIHVNESLSLLSAFQVDVYMAFKIMGDICSLIEFVLNAQKLNRVG